MDTPNQKSEVEKEKKRHKRKTHTHKHDENTNIENEKGKKHKRLHKRKEKENGTINVEMENSDGNKSNETENADQKEIEGQNIETGSNNNVKLDRYGWLMNDIKISKEEEKLTKKDAAKEFERSIKWNKMIQKWDYWLKKKMNKVLKRIDNGIPDAIRFKVWCLILESDHYKEMYPKTMKELLEEGENESYGQIDKDLNRTFPQIGFFSQPSFIESLRNVLYCYSHVDPEVEYTQGIGFLAGMLLVYMDEENAYYCLVSLMMGKKINHRAYFLDFFPRLQRVNAMLFLLIKKKCPEIIELFGNEPNSLSVFTTRWFLTSFQSFNFQPEFQIRIFERFLTYGTRFLLSFGITIIMFHRDVFRNLQFEDILHLLQHPDESEKMRNWHSFFELLSKEMLSLKKYESLIVKSCGKVDEFDKR